MKKKQIYAFYILQKTVPAFRLSEDAFSCQYWLDTVSFQMIFEFAAPTTVIVNYVGSKLAPMIHYQLPQWTEPPITFNHLIDYKLAVLCIDLKELPTSQHQPGCVIQDHADLDTGPIPFMPVYTARPGERLCFRS